MLRGSGLLGKDAIRLTGNSNSQEFPLILVESPNAKSIQVKLSASDFCVADRNEFDKCMSKVHLNPGVYFLRVENHGGRSNRRLVLVRSYPSPICVDVPKGREKWRIGTTHRLSWEGSIAGNRYQFSVQSARTWWETDSIAPSVVGQSGIDWVAGTSCGREGCAVDLKPGEYYVVVEDAETAIQSWSTEPIKLVR